MAVGDLYIHRVVLFDEDPNDGSRAIGGYDAYDTDKDPTR